MESSFHTNPIEPTAPPKRISAKNNGTRARIVALVPFTDVEVDMLTTVGSRAMPTTSITNAPRIPLAETIFVHTSESKLNDKGVYIFEFHSKQRVYILSLR